MMKAVQIICLKIKEFEGSINSRLDGLESRVAALERSKKEKLVNASELKDERLKVKRAKTKNNESATKSRWRQSTINTHPSNGSGWLIGNEKRSTKTKRQRELIDTDPYEPVKKRKRLRKSN